MANKPHYLRRCHLCGHITENSEDRVDKCEHCGKHMAKYYYYDEQSAPIFADNLLRPPYLKNEYQALLGISVVWDS